jgi:hypothetical protein
LKSFVIWKASVKVIKVKMKVVKQINRAVIQKKSSLQISSRHVDDCKSNWASARTSNRYSPSTRSTRISKGRTGGKYVCLVLYKCIFDVDWVDSWSWTPKMHTTTINKIL